MSAKEIGAIKVQNEKGEDTVAKVKVKRYFPGKAPVPAQKGAEGEPEDVEGDVVFPAAALKGKAKIAGDSVVPLGPHEGARKIDSAMESVDRRLQRLKESRTEGGGAGGRREIYEGEVVKKRRSESPERRPAAPSSTSRREEKEEKVEEEEEEEEDEDEIDRRRARMREAAKRQQQQQAEEEPDELLKNLKDEEEEEEESEYETDSEEEDQFPTRTLAKPIFIPKGERKTIEEREKLLREEAEVQMKNEAKIEERKAETQQMVAEEVRKLVEGNPQAEKHHEATEVDDADIENDVEEYEKWKLRELMRIKREREEREKEEQERQETERRRNMTDREIIEENKTIPEKQKMETSKYKFMQKYYHKGAFYQDQGILERDYNQPTLDDKFNKEMLPKVLQVKDFGFAGRTKYTNLKDQDTSQKDAGWSQKSAINMRMQNKLGGLRDSFEKPKGRKRKADDDH